MSSKNMETIKKLSKMLKAAIQTIQHISSYNLQDRCEGVIQSNNDWDKYNFLNGSCQSFYDAVGIKTITIGGDSEYSKLHRELIQLREFRSAIKRLCFQWECVDKPFTDEQITSQCRDLIDVCADCDVADRMRKLVYLVSNGMMSYANYTYEAMKEVYYEQIEKQVKQAIINPEKKKALLATLKECSENGDWESAHGDADNALIEFIDDVEISDAFEQVGKWYA